MDKGKERAKTIEDIDGDGVQFASPTEPIDWLQLGGMIAFITLLVVVAYTYCMTSEFVFNDGLNYQASVGAKDASQFWLRLFNSAVESPLSQPWLKATYRWDIANFNLMAGWSHAANACLHLLSCLYLFAFVFRISRYFLNEDKTKLNPYHVAFAATALFACHPLTTGSIAYVSGREGVLAGCNYFLGLNCFLFAFFEDRLYLVCVGYLLFYTFTVAGFLANPDCFTLPFAALALGLILKPGQCTWEEWLKERWYECVFLLLVPGLAITYLFKFAYPARINNGFGLATLTPHLYWASQFKALVTYYLRSTLVPFGLSIDPQFVIASGWTDPFTLVGIAVISITPLLIWKAQREPLIQVALAIFILTLLPWLVLVQPELVADSRFYLPLAALAIIVGIPFARASTSNWKKTSVVLGAVVLTYTGLTIWRSIDWSTEKHLWNAELRINPNDARAHAFHANQLYKNGRIEAAKQEVAKALQYDPNSFLAQAQLGQLDLETNDYNGATTELRKALETAHALGFTTDQLTPLMRQLALAYFKSDQLSDAAQYAQVATKYFPNDSLLALILGKWQISQGQPLRALQILQEGYKNNQHNQEFLEPLAQAAIASGLPHLANTGYMAAKRAMMLSKTPSTERLFVRASLNISRLDDIEPTLKELLQKQPHDAEALFLYSIFDKLKGNIDKSASERKLSIELEPAIEKRILLPNLNKSKDQPKSLRVPPLNEAAQVNKSPAQPTPLAVPVTNSITKTSK